MDDLESTSHVLLGLQDVVHNKFTKEISLTNEILRKSLEEKYNLQETNISSLAVRENFSTVGNNQHHLLSEGVEMLTTVSGSVHTECMDQIAL